MAEYRLPRSAWQTLAATAAAGILAIVLCAPSERLIGAMFEADGQFELAAHYLLRWGHRYPRDYDARFRAADLMVKTVHPERAVAVLEEMARDFPRDPRILSRLVEIEDSQLNVAAATAGLVRLAQLAPEDAKVQKRLADQHRWDGDMERLVQRLRHLLTLGDFPAERAELADLLLSAERYEDLIAWFGKDLERRDAPVGARLALADAYLRTGRIDQAMAQLEEVLRLAPDLSNQPNQPNQPNNQMDQLRELARLLTDRGRFDEAVSLYRRRIAAAPQGPGAQGLNRDLGELYEDYAEQLARQGRRRQAVALLRARVAQEPTSVALRLALADLHGRRVNRVAVAELRDLVRLAPRSLEAHLALAERLGWIGDMNGAVAALSEALALAPRARAEEIRRMLARHLLWANRGEEAAAHYRALAEQTGAPADLAVLADLLLDLGHAEEALQSARALRERDPQRPQGRRLFARAAMAAGRFREARQELLWWTAHAPDDPTGWQLLAQCETELGHPDEALAAVRQAQRLGMTTRRPGRGRR